MFQNKIERQIVDKMYVNFSKFQGIFGERESLSLNVNPICRHVMNSS